MQSPSVCQLFKEPKKSSEVHLQIQLGAWLRQIVGTLQEKKPPRVGIYKNFEMHN